VNHLLSNLSLIKTVAVDVPGLKMTSQKLRDITRQLVTMLVVGDYQAIEKLTRRKRLSAEDIKRSVIEYGRKLVMPPEQRFMELDSIEVQGANPPAVGIRFDLWTLEEGRSDLTLEFTVRGDHQSYEVEIDDLHVL